MPGRSENSSIRRRFERGGKLALPDGLKGYSRVETPFGAMLGPEATCLWLRCRLFL